MKFISGIKHHFRNDDVDIKIPFYHRTSISFFNGSYVYYITRVFESNKSMVRELILTPIIPDNWHHVRRITINAIDSPGIINAITSKLRDLKINVNIEEALTTQLGAIHNINLIVDLGFYIHEKGVNTGGKIPKKLIDDLEGELRNLTNPVTNQSIVFEGQISIRELTFLESISNIPSNFALSKIPDFQFRDCNNQKIKNTNGHIVLSENILSNLNLPAGHSFYYTMFSDTEEKYIKIVFFDPNQSVVFIDVHHQDIYGAIAKFTEIIYKDYNYNILASYSHQQMQKERAHWYALIDITNKSKEFFTETLDALRTAKYGDIGANRKVLNVFLIESNVENIPEDIVINFGQNKSTSDGDKSDIYKLKRKLIEGFVSKYPAEDYKKAKEDFKKSYSLYHTHSVDGLINSVINTKSQQFVLNKKKIFIKGVSIIITLAVFCTLYLAVPKVKMLFLEFIKHTESILVVVVAILLYLVTHNFLEKKIKEFSK